MQGKPADLSFFAVSAVKRHVSAAFGDNVHQGTSKLGKVRFFTSKSKSCALPSVPEGLEVREDLNGVVSVAKPIPSTIPPADLNFVKAKVASLKHLADHRVTTKGDQILIHQPLGVANAVANKYIKHIGKDSLFELF